ncbi:MAG: hypothetical protein M3460_08170 [Actinomycetota bacterium]|nr:hypothetical protein [Actinomycetota bacterium]
MPQPRWSSELRGRSATARGRADGPPAQLRGLRRLALDRVERRRLIA